ncbi:hypothetical protein BJG92_03181 [Arthrobacter sp. SO5]|uniref:phosphotransferase family protein n=1 Tax=Arthrobacter sp. SO5 TaxID=1897055 RepID=UPI001E294739|nr:aminoglycoside phosphotransferase family protein [Arthrobacter sp. SO5]MCB5275630.1 hypothetical protein [Arthrobacter sp. SO5]
MTAVRLPLRDADHALAGRDLALPCLAVLLDDERLSELVGEAVRITRVRYKPATSALVAFLRTREGPQEGPGEGPRQGPEIGAQDYGWALTTAGNVKVHGRAESSDKHGGGVVLLTPAGPDLDAVIAVGRVEDDWALRKNIRWLRASGLERLGAGQSSGPGLFRGASRVLRYKPERRLVLLEHTATGPIVIKTAALAAAETVGRSHERLRQQGVPVLPVLGDAGCFRHGITASAGWGDGDLTASADPEALRRAGSALARLHGIPAEPGPGPSPETLVERQLTATCGMVTALAPALEGPAAQAAERIRQALRARQPAGARTGRPLVQVHGDFSADQVLVSGTEVRLIDFDRAHHGAPEADLGSFAAVDEMSQWRGQPGAPGPQTARLLEGYVQSGGEFDPAAVDGWAALRMFASCVEPFRDRTPDWAGAMLGRIDRAEELVR